MEPRPTATVVVVSRDRWAPAPRSLETLLARTDARHPVVVVDGAAPRHVAVAFDRAAASGRVRVVRRPRFLAGNEARNLGADGARTEWLAFVENDSILSPGWLDDLIEVGEAVDAPSVYPAYLMPGPDGLLVHGVGADLLVDGPEGARTVRVPGPHRRQRWDQVRPQLRPVPRAVGEPHAWVVRREVLERIGGFDEGLLGWFDHVDLALEHRALGLTPWLVPQATCLYVAPPPLALHDVATFMLRWGSDWLTRSLDRLCAKWGLDRNDPARQSSRNYRMATRSGLLTRRPRIDRVIEHLLAPADRYLVRRWEAQRHAG